MSEVPEDMEEAGSERFRPYPEYKDAGVEWLGEIPAHWQSLALGRITTSRCDGPFGSGLKSEHYSESGIRVVRLQNIGWAEFTDLDAAYLDEAYARLLGDHSVKEDDILIAGLGDDGHPVGRACVAPVKIEPAMVKADCFRFRLDRERALPRYAAFQLSATAAAVAGRYATGATRARMNLATSASRKIALPPLKEQEAIATFLDRETAKIDALVAKKERLIELLQEKRAALITRAVTRGLDPNAPMKDSGLEWLSEIPAPWEVKRLKNVSTFVTSGSRGWAEFYSEEGPLFLRIGNVQSGSIDLNIDDLQHVDPPRGSEGERTRVRPGDVLVSITALIGAVAVVSEDLPEAFVNQHLALIRLSTSEVASRWIAYCVMSPVGQTRFAADLYGGTKDGLGLDDIRSLVVLVPPFREQERIVAYLDSQSAKLMKLVQAVRTAVDFLKEFRSALISAAVTGKIDVREAVAR